MTSDGLGAKTRQLDLSSAASIEVETLRASWAAMINRALEKAEVADRVDHRSFERQGKSIEPTVKMGPIITAIERRAFRGGESGARHDPVTNRGQLNAAIREMRVLALDIERGLDFIGTETEKLVAIALSFASKARCRLTSLATLQRAAGNLGRGRLGLVRHERSRDLDRRR